MEKSGGNGVFYIPDREHFQLKNPEWKDDIWPEFMDGKNVFDYVDPEIMDKLEKLEQEEDEIRNKMEINEEDDDESSDLSDDLIEAHEEVMENKNLIRQKHKLVTGSQLPRKVRDLTATEKLMDKIRIDKQEGSKELKLLSQKKRRTEKERLKKNLLNETKGEDEDEEEGDDIMDIDEEIKEGEVVKQFKKPRMTKEQMEELKKREKIEAQKQAVVERLQRKIQKKWSRGVRVNEADRQIPSKMPKHLNTGHRGIGKTDRR